MSSTDDRIAAIERIKEVAYSHLYEGRVYDDGLPRRLTDMLFASLETAIKDGLSTGEQLSRSSAAKRLGTTTSANAFTNAIKALADALRRCRPDDNALMPEDEDGLGIAAVEAVIDGVLHLVIVRGPTSEHRKALERDRMLRLQADFRPLPRPHADLQYSGTTNGASSSSHQDTPAPSIASRPDEPTPHQLRRIPDTFIGRDNELNELLRTIAAHSTTLIAIQGPPGVGKTTLALALADRLTSDYPSQVFLDLRGNTKTPLSIADVMTHVVHAFRPNDSLPSSITELAGLYYSVLNRERALLVFDNAKDPTHVLPLLPRRNCFLIITSRQHFALPGLHASALGVLSESAACRLLLAIAPRCAGEAARIAKLCGFLPLALSAVGSAMAESSDIAPSAFADRLEDIYQRIQLVDPGSNTSFEASLSLSCELLSRSHRRQFEALGTFRGSFNLAAAAAVWNTEHRIAQDTLRFLCKQSLVTYDDPTHAYSLHDLVSPFAERRLSLWRRYQLRGRHAKHFLQVASGVTDGNRYRSPNQTSEGISNLRNQWPNIEAALMHARWHLRALYTECLYECRDFLTMVKPAAARLEWLYPAVSWRPRWTTKSKLIYARLLVELADTLYELRDSDHACKYARRALALSVQITDYYSTIGASAILSRAAPGPEAMAADETFFKACAAADAANPQLGSKAFARFAERFAKSTDPTSLENYLFIVRFAGRPQDEIETMLELVQLHYNSGALDRAAATAKDLIQIAQSYGSEHAEGMAHAYLALVYAEHGDNDQASASFQGYLCSTRADLWSYSQLQDVATQAMHWLGLGFTDRAFLLARIALDVSRERGDTHERPRAWALLGLAIARTIEDARDEAKAYAAEAVSTAHSVYDSDVEAGATWLLSVLATDDGNADAADSYREKALELLRYSNATKIALIERGLLRSKPGPALLHTR